MTQARRCWLTLLAVLAFALAWAPHGAAQTVAKTQFIEAKRRYDKGDYKDALIMFQYAWEHSQSPNARLYIGRCLGKLGKLVPAYEEFQATVVVAAEKAAEDDKYLSTRDAAAAEIVVLEPQIGRLVVMLDDSVPSAQVTLNGKPFPKERLGNIVPVVPGQATLVAKAAGRKDVVREVDVAEGQLASVALWFAPAPVDAPQGDDEPSPASPGPPNAGGGLTDIQIYGVALIAVGAVALGVGAAFGAAAASKYGSLEQLCGDERCTDQAYADVVDSGKTWETVSYITLAAGGGMALIGGAFVLLGGESDSSEQAGLAPLPGGGLVTYRASF